VDPCGRPPRTRSRRPVLPWVPPYGPGQFDRRELPPLRAVLDDLDGLGLLVAGGYADLDIPAAGPAWARMCCARMRTPSPPSP
jgi:hypothetical protein